MLFHSSTGAPVVDAQEDFLRARRTLIAARLVHLALRLPPARTDLRAVR